MQELKQDEYSDAERFKREINMAKLMKVDKVVQQSYSLSGESSRKRLYKEGR